MMFCGLNLCFMLVGTGVSPSCFIEKFNLISLICFGWSLGRDDLAPTLCWIVPRRDAASAASQ